MNDPKYIIIHTAAAGRDGKPVYQPFDVVKAYHTGPDLNWTDIGYHYYIEGDGKVVPGRAETTKGAHCKDMDMNSKSIGICCAGHGDLADFNEAQYASLYALCLDVMNRYGIDVGHVLGHRETGAKKTCPGTRVDMGLIRYELAKREKGTETPVSELEALEARVAILEEKVNGLVG